MIKLFSKKAYSIKSAIFSVIFVGASYLFSAGILWAQNNEDSGKLVPCKNDCDFNDFMELLSRILDFAIILAVIIFAVIFAWAGGKMLLSAGSVASRESAKKMILTAIKGFIIVLLAWLIVEMLFNSLGITDDFNPFK